MNKVIHTPDGLRSLAFIRRAGKGFEHCALVNATRFAAKEAELLASELTEAPWSGSRSYQALTESEAKFAEAGGSAREVDYPEMWVSDSQDGGSYVPVKFQPGD